MRKEIFEKISQDICKLEGPLSPYFEKLSLWLNLADFGLKVKFCDCIVIKSAITPLYLFYSVVLNMYPVYKTPTILAETECMQNFFL